MQFPKRSYNRVKQATHCEVVLKVKNYEGRNGGALQYKVWKPGRLQLARNDDSKAYGQLQEKVWNPGRQGLQMHDQEVLILFLLWEYDARASALNPKF